MGLNRWTHIAGWSRTSASFPERFAAFRERVSSTEHLAGLRERVTSTSGSAQLHYDLALQRAQSAREKLREKWPQGGMQELLMISRDRVNIMRQEVDTFSTHMRARWDEGGWVALREDARSHVDMKARELWQRISMVPPEAWEKYKLLLEERPIAGNSVTAGVIYGAGDFAAQKIEKLMGIESPSKEGYNTARTLRMMFFGCFFAGPIMSRWYPQLEKMTIAYRHRYQNISLGSWKLPISFRTDLVDKQERLVEVAVKVMVDNLFFQPPFLTLYFFAMGLLEGLPFSTCLEKTQRNFHAAWGMGFTLWIPAQSFNFWLVPVNLQALVVNVVNMVWKMSLSIFYHSREYGSKAVLQDSAGDIDDVVESLVQDTAISTNNATAKLGEQVDLLWQEVEALRSRQSREAEAIASLRRHLEEQTGAIRRSTEAITELANDAVKRGWLVEEPLSALRKQMDEQSRAIAKQSHEIDQLRVALGAQSCQSMKDFVT